jgi:hypothetical protein
MKQFFLIFAQIFPNLVLKASSMFTKAQKGKITKSLHFWQKKLKKVKWQPCLGQHYFCIKEYYKQ